MQTKNLIPLHDFCKSHKIKISFISSLEQNGLIEIVNLNQTAFIDINQLHHLEKMVRFHFDMDINVEGIETITHLLLRINTMHNEIIALRNQLRVYDQWNDI
jgi:hypothetical protein